MAYAPVIRIARMIAIALHCRARLSKDLSVTLDPICAATRRDSGAITGKIRSTRLDGTIDITKTAPTHQQISQSMAGEIGLKISVKRIFAWPNQITLNAIMRMLQGANLCSRC